MKAWEWGAVTALTITGVQLLGIPLDWQQSLGVGLLVLAVSIVVDSFR